MLITCFLYYLQRTLVHFLVVSGIWVDSFFGKMIFVHIIFATSVLGIEEGSPLFSFSSTNNIVT